MIKLIVCKGVTVSVITLKGGGCNVKNLGKVAKMTNGTVSRVDASNIKTDFSSILEDDLFGTNAEVKIILSRAIKFKGE